MLATELSRVDADSALWEPIQPLLNVAWWLDRSDQNSSWYGWRKQEIEHFLQELPPHCTLLLGVWDTAPDERGGHEQEKLVVSCVGEVMKGQVISLRTFGALSGTEIPSLDELEPGFEHALAIMRAVRLQIAPVAWALFTDLATWNEWLLTEESHGQMANKGELLALLARQGRCVLMGSQTKQHYE